MKEKMKWKRLKQLWRQAQQRFLCYSLFFIWLLTCVSDKMRFQISNLS